MTNLTLLTATTRMDAVVKTAGFSAAVTAVTTLFAIMAFCFLLYYLLWARAEEYSFGEALKEYFRILFFRIPKFTFGVIAAVIILEGIGFCVTCWDALMLEVSNFNIIYF